MACNFAQIGGKLISIKWRIRNRKDFFPLLESKFWNGETGEDERGSWEGFDPNSCSIRFIDDP